MRTNDVKMGLINVYFIDESKTRQILFPFYVSSQENAQQKLCSMPQCSVISIYQSYIMYIQHICINIYIYIYI